MFTFQCLCLQCLLFLPLHVNKKVDSQTHLISLPCERAVQNWVIWDKYKVKIITLRLSAIFILCRLTFIHVHSQFQDLATPCFFKHSHEKSTNPFNLKSNLKQSWAVGIIDGMSWYLDTVQLWWWVRASLWKVRLYLAWGVRYHRCDIAQIIASSASTRPEYFDTWIAKFIIFLAIFLSHIKTSILFSILCKILTPDQTTQRVQHPFKCSLWQWS